MSTENQHIPSGRPFGAAYWFIFHGDRLLLQNEAGSYRIPCGENPPILLTESMEIGIQPQEACTPFTPPIPLQAGATGVKTTYLPCRAASLDTDSISPEGMEWIMLRASYDLLGKELYNRAGKAFELVHWERNSRYCPTCGTRTQPHTAISRQCPSCHKEIFPSVSPAIIVLICKGDSILMVRTHQSKAKFMGLVAGFLETGETLEECVHREVREETGLQIRNLTYFGNQPWPYPSNLMVGFIADYADGEITLQAEELSHAEFYSRENLPELPPPLSLARRMIDWWLSQTPATTK